MKNNKPKKLSFALILSLVFTLMFTSMTAFADEFKPIVCTDGRFSNSELESLEELRSSVAEKTGWNICIVISDGFDGTSPMVFSDDYYDAHYPVNSDGIMFLYDMEERYISTSGVCINYLNDLRIEYLLDDIDYYYYDERDYDAVECFLNTVERYYDDGIVDGNYVFEGEYQGGALQEQHRKDIIEGYLWFFGISLIVTLICIACIIKKYKFHVAPSSNNYLDKNSIIYYQKLDGYVTTRTSRVRVNSSSGSGGSSGGSSYHRSSSGGCHGGGGHSGRR